MQILSVSQVVSHLRELLENNLVLGDVWISGEVSGPRTQPSGHTYFVLKDTAAQLHSVLFRATQQRQPLATQHLAQGSQVIVHGKLTVYEARGELQVVVDFVQPEGVGLRHAQFERLRLQLEEEGLFDASRKRPLPAFPRRIGVVTSPAGAVFHDICNVVRRRWPLAEVVLAPTPVQGADAPAGIVTAIDALNLSGDLDVIIIARGGGSIEELWAFNEEAVARAVFRSVVPTVSAVGHETDYTICDHVADLRAPTPSAAAELVVPDTRQLSLRIRACASAARQALERRLRSNREGILWLTQRAGRSVNLDRPRQRLIDLEQRGLNAFAKQEVQRRELLRRCQVHLTALDPQATLNRGYAVVHKGGRVVSSVAEVATGESLVIKVADGGFPSRVEAPGTRRRRKPAASTTRNGASQDSSGGRNGSAKQDAGIQPVLFP
jgi:exodeoxyribonuclease VII large subunit